MATKKEQTEVVKKVAARQSSVAHPRNPSAETLLAKAVEKGLPVEQMERLLEMRRELKSEAAREAFFTSLAYFQRMCPEVPKTKGVPDKSGKIRYRYAPLDVIIAHVKEALADHGFSYRMEVQQTESSVTAICWLHHIAGHAASSSFSAPIDPQAFMSAPQKVASAMTYAKRYAFCAVTGVMTSDEDDDAIIADDPQPRQEQRQKPQTLSDKKREDAQDYSRADPEKLESKFLPGAIRWFINSDKINDDDRQSFRNQAQEAYKIPLAEKRDAVYRVLLAALKARHEGKDVDTFEDDIPGEERNVTPAEPPKDELPHLAADAPPEQELY